MDEPHCRQAGPVMRAGVEQPAHAQDVKGGGALRDGTAGHLVEASFVGAGGSARSLGDAKDDAQACPLELIAHGAKPATGDQGAGQGVELQGSPVDLELFVIERRARGVERVEREAKVRERTRARKRVPWPVIPMRAA